MRPIIAGITAGLSVAIINRFFSGLSNQLLVGLVVGAINGVGVMYLMRKREPHEGDGK